MAFGSLFLGSLENMKIQIAIILSLITVVSVFGIYLLHCLRLALRSVHWPSTKANITRCEVNYNNFRNRVNGSWKLKLLYSYKVENEIYMSTRFFFGDKLSGIPRKEMTEIESKFKANQQIDVHYMPTDPQTSIVKSGVHNNLKIALLVLGAMLFFLISILSKFL